MMFKFCKKLFTDSQVYAWNFINNPQENKKYKKTELLLNDDVVISPEELKKLRINIILYIKQCKNTYFKYTNKEIFNKELYDSFIDNEHFDGGNTAFDDEDNIRIFDKYILEYIKSRNEIITYLQCKNKIVNLRTKLDDLRDFRSSDVEKDILFVIDMSDKDIFNFCYDAKKDIRDNNVTKSIVLSMVFKLGTEYVKIKLDSSKNKEYHPHMMLESCIQ
jgi:hypothetical protein